MILRKENNINLLEFHLKNETYPNQLFFDKFPTPFLLFDEQFVNNYNKIIKETQIQIMTLAISSLTQQTDTLKNNRLEIKKDFINFTNPDNELKILYEVMISKRKSDFDKADEKA